MKTMGFFGFLFALIFLVAGAELGYSVFKSATDQCDVRLPIDAYLHGQWLCPETNIIGER